MTLMSKSQLKTIALLFLFILQTGAVCAFTQQPSEAINLNNIGVNKLNKGDLDAAIINLTDALKISPNYELAKSNLSIAYDLKASKNVADGQYEPALHLYEKARFLFPFNQTGFENHNHLLKIMGFNPDSELDRVSLANQAILRGDLEAFLVEFQEAIEIAGEHVASTPAASEEQFYKNYGEEIASQLQAIWHPDSNCEPFTFKVNAHITANKFRLFSKDWPIKDAKLKEVLETEKTITKFKSLYQRQKTRLLHFSFIHNTDNNEVRYEGNERDFY